MRDEDKANTHHVPKFKINNHHLPGASYSTRICVDDGTETCTHLALPDSMSNCGNAATPGAADGSQTANARSARRRVVGLAVVVGDMAYFGSRVRYSLPQST